MLMKLLGLDMSALRGILFPLTSDDMMLIIVYAAIAKNGKMNIMETSNRIVQMRKNKLFLTQIAIRSTPHGYYSQDLADFAHLLTLAGLLKKVKPFTYEVTKKGRDNLRQDVDVMAEKNPLRTAQILNFLETPERGMN
jgi:hypothetical protein